MSEEKAPRVRIAGMKLGTRYHGNDPTGEVTVTNLFTGEVDRFRHAIDAQCSWVGVDEEGRLETREKHKPLPEPTVDSALAPHWNPGAQRPLFGEKPQDFSGPKNFDFDTIEVWNYPSILIQHLCGYNYSPENYKHEADKLESYGFHCLRSRRGASGQFWEVWFLPSLVFAEGKLGEVLKDRLVCGGCGSVNIRPESFSGKDTLEEGDYVHCLDCMGVNPRAKMQPAPKTEKDKLRRALDFLLRNCSFGALDVCCQRAAMVAD
jgi:hypothetical protein